jgi:hypothetical protein
MQLVARDGNPLHTTLPDIPFENLDLDPKGLGFMALRPHQTSVEISARP